jgi:hypothetical protein
MRESAEIRDRPAHNLTTDDELLAPAHGDVSWQ